MIFKCVQCHRLHAKETEQKIVNLAVHRLSEPSPFTYWRRHVVAGLWNQKIQGYVHLNEMESSTQWETLECFIAQTDNVWTKFSDNRSNFMGSQNQLSRAVEEIVNQKLQTFT